MYELEKCYVKILMEVLEDGITDGIEDAIYRGKITADVGAYGYRLAGHRLGLRGLFTHRLVQNEGDYEVTDQLMLFKDNDHVPPKDVLIAACETYDKSIGMAAISNGKIIMMREVCKPSAEKLFTQMTAMTALPMILALRSNETSLDYVSPFVMLGSLDDPDMIAFFQGKISIVDKLKKKLIDKELNKVAGGDFKKFWANITEADTADEIRALMEDDNCLLLFTRLDTGGTCMMMYQTGQIEVEYPWGASYGVPKPDNGGQPAPTPVPADAFKMSMAQTSDTGTPSADAAAASGKKYPRPVSVPLARFTKDQINDKNFPLKGKIDSNTGAIIDIPTEPLVHCPETIEGKRVDKRMNHAWYTVHLGSIPDNWDKKPGFPKSMFIEETAGTDTSAVALATARTIPSGPNLNQATIGDLQSFLSKTLGSNNIAIDDPGKFLELAKDVKSIAEELGKKNLQECALPWVACLMLCAENDKIMPAKFMYSFMIGYLQQTIRIKQLEEYGQAQEEEISKLNSAIQAGTKTSVPAFGSMST